MSKPYAKPQTAHVLKNVKVQPSTTKGLGNIVKYNYFCTIKQFNIKLIMKKVIVFALFAALAASCQKDLGGGNNTVSEKEQAEKALGFEIAADQSWNMETEVSVRVKNLPSGFVPVELAVYSANPLIDTTATVIASSEDVASTLTFNSPSYLTTLYAGCADKNGNLRVVAFDKGAAVADFSKLALKETSASAPRRAAALTNASELNWQDSYNAQDMAGKGWADKVAVISGAYDESAITEEKRQELYGLYNGWYGSNDVDRLLHFDQSIRSFYYATVGQGGGEVTVTPVASNGTNNSKLFFGYYYFEKGQAHNVKTVNKYLFNEVYNGATKFNNGLKEYKLVYYDAAGNASYTFPEGTEIGFFCRAENVNSFNHVLEWYAEGEANIDRSQFMIDNGIAAGAGGAHDWWMEANHVIMFERNGYKMIGFEDWINNFNLKDIVAVIDGNLESFPALSKPQNAPNHHIYTFAFEDTKNGDYDLNDVVLQVYRGKSNVNGLFVKLVALGAHDPLKAYFKDKVTGEVTALFGGKELHEAFGVELTEFINTESINFTKVKGNKNLEDFVYRKDNPNTLIWESLCAQDFYIYNEKTNTEIHTPRSQGLLGAAPYGLCIPHPWAWPKERVCITSAYSRFADFASAVQGGALDATDWYTKSNSSRTLFYDFGFTVN